MSNLTIDEKANALYKSDSADPLAQVLAEAVGFSYKESLSDEAEVIQEGYRQSVLNGEYDDEVALGVIVEE